jgi:hypothetical protein
MLDLYTQEDCNETLAALGEYLTALVWKWCNKVWAGLWVEVFGTTLGNLM